MLVRFGGGARDVDVRILPSPRGTMLVVHLLVDARDAGGMNAVNTMCEALAPELARLASGRVVLRIISNLATLRLSPGLRHVPGGEARDGGALRPGGRRGDPGRLHPRARGPVPVRHAQQGDHERHLGGGPRDRKRYPRDRERRPHLRRLHRPGPAASSGPSTTFERDEHGNLVGTIELPVAVGLIGGATAVHPTARANVKLLGVKSATELAQVIAAVGLAQNFGALRALATEGIQRGHMELHARNIAVTAGARPDEVDRVVARLVEERAIRINRAEAILREIRGGRTG